jgi:hypothetical protein
MTSGGRTLEWAPGPVSKADKVWESVKPIWILIFPLANPGPQPQKPPPYHPILKAAFSPVPSRLSYVD